MKKEENFYSDIIFSFTPAFFSQRLNLCIYNNYSNIILKGHEKYLSNEWDFKFPDSINIKFKSYSIKLNRDNYTKHLDLMVKDFNHKYNNISFTENFEFYLKFEPKFLRYSIIGRFSFENMYSYIPVNPNMLVDFRKILNDKIGDSDLFTYFKDEILTEINNVFSNTEMVVETKDIIFKDNTTNLFYSNSVYPKFNNNSEMIFNSIKRVEIKDYFNDFVYNTDEYKYYTGGRIHFLSTSNDLMMLNRVLSIHYYAQFLWHYLSDLYEFIESSSLQVYDSNNLDEEDLKLIVNLVQVINNLNITNSFYMTKFESDRSKFFDIIDKNWNLSNFLITINLYISKFNLVLSKSYEFKQNAINEKQNRSLYIISAIQVIGLIGIWSSIIGLIDYSESDGLFANLFITTAWLFIFNTFIFLVLTFITIKLIYRLKK